MNAQTNPFNFDLTKILSEYKVPGVDMTAVMDSQKKNIEALTAANQAAFDGVQKVLARQAEILQESLKEAAEVAAKPADLAADPKQAVTKQAELAQEAIEKNISNMKELAELMAKANTDAFELLNKRFNEVMEEVKTVGK